MYTHEKSGSSPVSPGPDQDPASSETDHMSDLHDSNDSMEEEEIYGHVIDEDKEDQSDHDDRDSDDDSSSDFHSTSTLSESSGSGYATPDYSPPVSGRTPESFGILESTEEQEEKTKPLQIVS